MKNRFDLNELARSGPATDDEREQARKAGPAAGDHGRNGRSHHAPTDAVDARRRACEDAQQFSF
jgi:hypothetical protein